MAYLTIIAAVPLGVVAEVAQFARKHKDHGAVQEALENIDRIEGWPDITAGGTTYRFFHGSIKENHLERIFSRWPSVRVRAHRFDGTEYPVPAQNRIPQSAVATIKAALPPRQIFDVDGTPIGTQATPFSPPVLMDGQKYFEI